MAFKDILNKGMDILNSSAKKIGDAAKEKKAAMQEFDLLKTRSDRLGPMSPYVDHNDDPQDGKEQMILNICLTINVEKARVVNRCLPIDETVVDVRTGKEAQTEIEYSLVATDKKLWIINKNEFMTMEFDAIKNCEIVNKGIMTQGVKFDDKAFVLDGNETDVLKFFEVLKNTEVRRNLISQKTNYLMGIVPRRQILNLNIKGITIGDDGNVVLHNGVENKVVNIKDIVSAQLMVNDTAALIKGRTDSSNFMSSPMEARKMTVKIILGMGEYDIETMPQNVMNTSYRREDATYINNYNFAKKIVDALGELIREDPINMNSTPNPATSTTQTVNPNLMSTSIPTINPFTNPMATGEVNNNQNNGQP